jgi:hypothetical protein
VACPLAGAALPMCDAVPAVVDDVRLPDCCCGVLNRRERGDSRRCRAVHRRSSVSVVADIRVRLARLQSGSARAGFGLIGDDLATQETVIERSRRY